MRWQTAHDVLVELQWIAGAPRVHVPARKAPVPRIWIAATAVLGLFLSALAFVHFREKPSDIRPIRFSISPPERVTFADLFDAGPALISPDGSRLAFVGVDAQGKSQLWVRQLDALVAQPLGGTTNAVYPFWSADSQYLGFFADGRLNKVSASGGPPQTLCDAPGGRGGSWAASKDGGPGVIVFAPNYEGALARVSEAGGEPVQVTALDSSRQEHTRRQPEFLRDGHHFLYVAISNRAENNGIFIGDVQARPDPKNVRRLMGGDAHVSYAPPGYLLFLRDNNLMARAFDAGRFEFTGETFVLADHAQIRVRISDVPARSEQHQLPNLATSGSLEQPISAIVEKINAHTQTVRFAPQGDPTGWEIGEPYVPYSLLPSPSVQTLQIEVEWDRSAPTWSDE
jgi:eukaryotic-like serine/threonine-protein kinase